MARDLVSRFELDQRRWLKPGATSEVAACSRWWDCPRQTVALIIDTHSVESIATSQLPFEVREGPTGTNAVEDPLTGFSESRELKPFVFGSRFGNSR